MPTVGAIKPSHQAIKAYDETAQAYRDQQVTHEGAEVTAFQGYSVKVAGTDGSTSCTLRVIGEN